VGQFEEHIPLAAKAAIDFAAVTARLKPCPSVRARPQPVGVPETGQAPSLRDIFPHPLKRRERLVKYR